jgi:hypothetical protein
VRCRATRLRIALISQDASTLTVDPHGNYDDVFDAGDIFVAGPGTGNRGSERQYTITYSAADGRNVIVHLVTEDGIGGNTCVVSGFAMGAP